MSDKEAGIVKIILVVGALLTLVGYLVARERTAAAVLVSATYVLGLGLGGLLFLVFGFLTNAGWSTAIRRVPEALGGLLPLGALLMVLSLAGMPVLYEWTHSNDPLIQKKAAWLNEGFFLVRAAIYLALWLLFGAALRAMSRKQDQTGDPRSVARMTALSAVFLIVFAFTFSAASFDWIMSLEAQWFSTVFGVYCFSGVFLAALAAITVGAILLRRRGPLRGILRPDHLHDMGKLMLGFSTFWAYIWFCQYMLIWYSHIPEETSYYVARFHGAWGPLMVLNPIVNFLVPFLVLLSRPAKRSESVMLGVALLLLVGRWLDLYLLVNPALMSSPQFGVWEIAPVLMGLSLAAMAFFRVFRRGNPVPGKDPMLVESLHHHI